MVKKLKIKFRYVGTAVFKTKVYVIRIQKK